MSLVSIYLNSNCAQNGDRVDNHVLDWLFLQKVDQIEKAQVQIKADLPSPETILAVIYETGSKYRELDDVLTDLEKRRRRILEDYQNLQNARAIDLKAAE